jgi:hypothetical protein
MANEAPDTPPADDEFSGGFCAYCGEPIEHMPDPLAE